MLNGQTLELLNENPIEEARKVGYSLLTGLHNEWISDMVFGIGDMTIQAHRGSYKTTCLGISFALIIILFPRQRTMFFRKTDTDVAEVMKATTSILESAAFKAIAKKATGIDLVVTKTTQTEVQTNLATGVSGASQLVGMGCGGSVTGKHADRIFTDDIITLRDRVSAAERRRIDGFYQELQNVRNPGGRIVNTGTPWHKDDTFRLMPNIRKWDCYSSDLMTREQIEAKRKGMTASLFAANYELKHIADEDAIFQEPTFFSDPTRLYDGIGHIDAAYGGGDGTAFTAIKRNGREWHCHIRLWNKHVDECVPEILSICKKLRIGTLFCETNADKGYLRKSIVKRGHPCAGYAESTNKFIKISTHLKSEWENVRILDCDGYPLDAAALSQVLDYSEYAEHDDMPDSMASAIRQYERRPGFKGFEEGI